MYVAPKIAVLDSGLLEVVDDYCVCVEQLYEVALDDKLIVFNSWQVWILGPMQGLPCFGNPVLSG